MAIDAHTLETIIRRAKTVEAELLLFTDDEYPVETIRLRDLLLSLTRYITATLDGIRQSRDYSQERSLQVQQLARSVHELYAMLRYLRASGSLSTPPALQAVVSYLVSRFADHDRKWTIVRPQWQYNCKFVNLSYELSKITVARLPALTAGGGHLLDYADLAVPGAAERAADPVAASRTVLGLIRERERRMATAENAADDNPHSHADLTPPFIGILSLAGIEKHDVFMYPMMAHEVAHFVAYSRPSPSHLAVTAKIAYTRETLDAELRSSGRRYVATELSDLVTITTRRIEICVRELLADLIAVRILGVGFFLGLAYFLRGLFQWSDPLVAPDSSYPSMRLRLKLCFEELLKFSDIRALRPYIGDGVSKPKRRADIDPTAQALATTLGEWRKLLSKPLKAPPIPPGDSEDIDDDYLHSLCTQAIVRKHSLIVKAARQIAPIPVISMTRTLQKRVEHLQHRLPPLLSGDREDTLPEIFTAGWLYRLMSPAANTPEYERRNRLLTKAIELASSKTSGAEIAAVIPPSSEGPLSGVLTGEVITARGALPIGDSRRLAVIPSNQAPPEAASLDVRLGNWFKLSRRPKLPSIDISRAKEFLRAGVLHDEFFVKTGESFILHAGDFALGITQEFFGMPCDVMAFVEGKSSIGRTGLIVATATQVAPGFHGCIVLELANTGTVPLEIKPGMKIAQLVLIGTSGPVSSSLLYGGDYDCQIRP